MTNYLNYTIVDELRLIMEDDTEVLFIAYLEDVETQFIELVNAIAAKDCDFTRRIAHTIKGSSRNVGATQFSDFCESLELAARNEEVHLWAALLEEMKKSFTATKIQIKQEVLS